MEQKITIELVKKLNPESVEAIRELTKQIGSNYSSLSDEALQEMINASVTRFLLAKIDEKIVGMTTLIVYRIPYVKKAIIEDVVVDKDHRKLGIGSQLMKKAVAVAKGEGAKFVFFTSKPHREAANQLYQKLGFTQRETNYYRFDFDK